MAPGLYQREQRVVLPLVAGSTLLFMVGAAFGYFVVMPFAYEYFLGLAAASPIVDIDIDLARAYGFALRFLLIFGVIFELPIVVLTLARLGLVRPATLWRQTRYVIVIAFVVGAVLTPPDPFTQVALAVPLIVLYVASVGLAALVVRPSGTAGETSSASRKPPSP